MKTKIFEASIDEKEMIKIPESVLEEMGLKKGDSLEISYPVPTEAIERLMLE